MPMGFVYILFNPAFPGKVKIGLTTDSSEQRAKDIYKTGTPERFHVVYDELVSDCGMVEHKMHERFDGFRNNKQREFFDIPIKDAVRTLATVAKPYLVPDSALANHCEILPKLTRKFPKLLAGDLSSVAIIQLDDLLVLESRRRSSRDEHEELVERVDLGFIFGIEETFPRDRSVKDNAVEFVRRLNLSTLLVIAESLFNEVGLQKAIEEYNGGIPSTEPEEIDGEDSLPNRLR